MQPITPCLWFDHRIEEAVMFYVSLFPDSRITAVSRYPEGSMQPAGTIMVMNFELGGRLFQALNGGPIFKFNEAVSFSVPCADQAEIDRYWTALTADGGEESQCGWLKDRWGLSWQIVPEAMDRWMADPEAAARVTAAFMPMKKLDVAVLEQAARG